MRRASSANRSPTSSVLARTWRTILSHCACKAGSLAVITSRFGCGEDGAWGSDAPRFRRGALGSLAMPVSPQIGHSTRPRASCPWKSSSEPNQPSKPCLCAHCRVRTFMALIMIPVELPAAVEDILQPEGADQRLGVGDRAVAAPVDHL